MVEGEIHNVFNVGNFPTALLLNLRKRWQQRNSVLLLYSVIWIIINQYKHSRKTEVDSIDHFYIDHIVNTRLVSEAEHHGNGDAW